MKYSININQKSIIENKLDIDVIDAVILEFMTDFAKTEVIVSVEENGTKFHWFSHEKIIQELPILQLKKDSVFRRLKKLCEKGFLIQYSKSQVLGRSFYSITKLTDSTFGRKSEGSDENPKGRKTIRRVGRKSEVVGFNPKGVRTKIRRSSETNPNDNNINIIKPNDKTLFSDENFEKEVEKSCPIYKDAVKIYFDFFKERNGISPKFDGGDGKALKSLIVYFKRLHKEKNDGSDVKQYVLSSLKFIFDNWEQQVDFIRNKTKMTEINSNINNIINKLRNAKSKSTSENGRNQGNKIVGKSRKFTIDEFVQTSNDSSE